MKIAVVADEKMKLELLAQGFSGNAEISWFERPEAAELAEGDVLIDLLFQHDSAAAKTALEKSPVAVKIVNDVNGFSEGWSLPLVRINGWPGFLKRPVVEATGGDEKMKAVVEEVFQCFGKKITWLSGKPGFITARVVSMIINEAYFALEEGVSSREEIDLAMKTGTNYPYGPFEWCNLIGVKNVYGLLMALRQQDEAYETSGLLKNEAAI